jgi:hypothetical protein
MYDNSSMNHKKTPNVEIVRSIVGAAILPIRIAFINARELGTHENTDDAKLNAVDESIRKNGYSGPAITVFECGNDIIYDTLVDGINRVDISSGKYGTFGIADGHNRLATLLSLIDQHVLKTSLIPVQIIPAHDSSMIRVGVSSEDEQPLTVAEIEGCFTSKSLIIPANSTAHFQALLSDGSWKRLKYSQPMIKFSLSNN